MNNPVARIIDVNLNRAGEALRTLEEYARFIMDSKPLAKRCKSLRHQLHSITQAWNQLSTPENRPVANRDIASDVGASIKTSTETNRPNALAVAAAAAKRGEESLRALSEYAKIDHPDLAQKFEQLRYNLYDIEPIILADNSLRQKLNQAKLYVLISSHLCSTSPAAAAREACLGGADVIQLREKEMEDAEFHRLATQIVDVCRDHNTLFIVNDRPHIASLVDAAGVHCGQGDLPVSLTRRLLGPDKLIGRSTSDQHLAKQALADGADYIGVGPAFETTTKKGRPPAGLEYVRWTAEWDGLPYFAIGGINRNTIGHVLQAGARAVAVCTGITMADDIASETAWFKEQLTKG